MNTAPFGIALLFSTFSTFAQGVFNFANFGEGANAPIVDPYGHRLNGPGFAADLYWAHDVVTDSTVLTALGEPARFWTNGYFFGGERTIPGVGAFGVITAQVRVWNAAYYPSWEAAISSPIQDRFAGISALFQFTLNGPPPYLPLSLTGLQPFYVGSYDCGPIPSPFEGAPTLRIVNNINTILLTWPAYECDRYLVQQNPTLNADNWLTLTNDHVLVGSTNETQNQVLLPAPPGTMFYRLVWQ